MIIDRNPYEITVVLLIATGFACVLVLVWRQSTHWLCLQRICCKCFEHIRNQTSDFRIRQRYDPADLRTIQELRSAESQPRASEGNGNRFRQALRLAAWRQDISRQQARDCNSITKLSRVGEIATSETIQITSVADSALIGSDRDDGANEFKAFDEVVSDESHVLYIRCLDTPRLSTFASC
uniref:AlNc14C217G9033 protein n=1 Tax=Albugo laibachii Nc14 TaxID=890382 RepID=F0WRN5_9STRA|nr:AlNc14C217G9033 [Albugo laibachii Nc14]|eukprot:CCA23999.1 AlNc14C217G9033 [Albugo laibachii Nc14]